MDYESVFIYCVSLYNCERSIRVCLESCECSIRVRFTLSILLEYVLLEL